MDEKAKNYLIAEIVEEGDLFICFSYLRENFDITIDHFSKALSDLADQGLVGFYVYSPENDIVDISFSEIDFTDIERLKSVNFDPSTPRKSAYQISLV